MKCLDWNISSGGLCLAIQFDLLQFITQYSVQYTYSVHYSVQYILQYSAYCCVQYKTCVQALKEDLISQPVKTKPEFECSI